MAEIVLTTLNAKYIHAAFGLRYLLANLGDLRSRARLLEFDINQRPVDIVEILLAQNPKIIGLGVYIWNAGPTFEVVSALKRLRPDVVIVLGGPEVSYEFETQPIAALADYVVTGEADLKFAQVCRHILAGEMPQQKIIPADLPDFTQLSLPYDLYTEQDIAHRVIYIEASRGCPFTCEFCLSSLDIPVRQVPLPLLLEALGRLLERGVRQFKFVDRTFNLNVAVSRAILEFCLARYRPGLFFHFEMVPDRLPDALREVIARFPPGALQFEVGIQTFNETVGELIKRRQNYARLEDNLRFLRQQTGVHVHADLIVGLPGEELESFVTGFDRLVALGPQEIQVGLLKRLRGTPIVRHDRDWQMVYNPLPPYEILSTRLISFAMMQKLRRFARFWDLVGNSGNFIETTPLLWSRTPEQISENHVDKPPRHTDDSPFYSFLAWSEWAHSRVGQTTGIALVRLMELLFEYLTQSRRIPAEKAAMALWRDYQRSGRHDKPRFLREFLPGQEAIPQTSIRARSGLKRQRRHGAATLEPSLAPKANPDRLIA